MLCKNIEQTERDCSKNEKKNLWKVLVENRDRNFDVNNVAM